jgi:TolB-like protein
VNYQFGDCSLDTGSLELKRSGDLVALEPQVFRLIVCLIENRDRVVSKNNLIEKVWDRRIISDGALNTCINSARNAVGDNGKTQAVIKTFPRRGFRFVADVVDIQPGPFPAGSEASPLPDKPSIAVLPFENLSGDPDQEYFADGLAEDLITDLSKISGLFVIARNSAFAFKGQTIDVRRVAEELGVRHVLEGSVRKAGGKVRINAQLIDAASGGHVWAERYDGDLKDIFSLQDKITAQIVSALQVSLTPTDKALTERKPTDIVEAYDLFLRGRANFYLYTPEHTLEAIKCLEHAIQIDPNFGDAYSYLSFCYFIGCIYMFPGFDHTFERSYEVAEKGVALDRTSAVALARLGWVQAFLRRYDQAIANFEQAIALEPNNAEAYAYFGQTLNYWGDPEKGLELIEKALSIEKIPPPNWDLILGHSHLLMQRYDEALGRFLKTIERAPMFTYAYLLLACAQIGLNRLDEARDTIKTALEITPRYTVKEAAGGVVIQTETPRSIVFLPSIDVRFRLIPVFSRKIQARPVHP